MCVQNYAGSGIIRGTVAVTESAPQANMFALFVQQQTNISTDTERRATLLAIAELLVYIDVMST